MISGVLQLENNLISGTIPYDECGQFHFLTADCLIPGNIDCKCCTDFLVLFNYNRDVLPCPTSALNINFDFRTGKSNVFAVRPMSKSFIAAVEKCGYRC